MSDNPSFGASLDVGFKMLGLNDEDIEYYSMNKEQAEQVARIQSKMQSSLSPSRRYESNLMCGFGYTG